MWATRSHLRPASRPSCFSSGEAKGLSSTRTCSLSGKKAPRSDTGALRSCDRSFSGSARRLCSAAASRLALSCSSLRCWTAVTSQISRRKSASRFSVATRTSCVGSDKYFLEIILSKWSATDTGYLTHRSPSRNSGKYVMSSSSGTESRTVIHDTR